MTDVIEERLSELAGWLDIGGGDRDLVAVVLAHLDDPVRPLRRAEVRRRTATWAVALAAALIAVVLILPSPRRTVAHWFGIGSTKIEGPPVTGAPPTATTTPLTTAVPPTNAASTTSTATTLSVPATEPASLRLGPVVSAAEATARTGLPAGTSPALGAPLGIHVTVPPATGQITVVYPPSPTLPASPVTGVGALLSTMPGTIDDGLFVKVEAAGTSVETLTVTTATGASVPAIWLSGAPHDYVFVDSTGSVDFDSLRLATNTLLWQVGDVTYRLEADVTRQAAIDLAATVVSG